MRIVVWNCKMGLARKRERLYALAPDVAVIPECGEKCIRKCMEDGFSGRWFGENPKKGLGVLVAAPWKIVRAGKPRGRWVAPVWISGPSEFLLVAVWTAQIQGSVVRSYVGQAWEAVTKHPWWFRRQAVMVCGDFNSNRIWDGNRKTGNHSALVNYLGKRKVVSAYHRFFSEEQGEETRATHYFWHRKERGFHIDYVFLPEDWAGRIAKVEVGEHEEWSKMSDHVPVAVEVG